MAQVVYNHSTADAYTVQYLDILVDSIFDTTMKDINKQTQEASLENGYDLERTYALSDERATFIGANEANSIGNREEWLRAIEEGYTYKKWVAFNDNRTRKDHEKMDGKKIPIRDYFKFPDCKMLYPHDEANGSAKQTVNCRCVNHYSFGEDLENEESRKFEKSLNQNTRVNKNLLAKEVLRNRLRLLGEDVATTREIVNIVDEMLKHRDGTDYEDLAYVNSLNYKSKINKSYDYYDAVNKISACKPNKAMKELLKASDEYSVIGIHNHAHSNSPSFKDIKLAHDRKYKYGVVVSHDGTIYKYDVKNADTDSALSKVIIDNSLERLQKAIYNNDEEKMVQNISVLSDNGVIIEVFR